MRPSAAGAAEAQDVPDTPPWLSVIETMVLLDTIS